MTTFHRHQDVAVVEHDEAGKPFEGGRYWPGTVTEAGPCSVRVRLDGGGDRLFLLDSRGRAWRESGWWRLVPLCRCDLPVTGEPVTDEEDPTGRVWCSEACLTAAAEVAYGQCYPSGIAT